MTTPQREFLSIQAVPDIAGIRTAQLIGAEHTVVPCVALVEGVLWPANSPHPELALAQEFGRFPEGWNGRPVMMGHPFIDEIPVSASTPEVLETSLVGQLFNTRLDGTKLKTELWINNERVAELGGDIEKQVNLLTSGEEVVEVSTGLFMMSELVDGEFEGEEYHAIWRNIVPDHLAILPPGATGACSVADGCGAPRTNKMKPVMRANRLHTADPNEDAPVITHTDCDCGGTCDKCVTLRAAERSLIKRIATSVATWIKDEWQSSDNVLRTTVLSKHLSDHDLRVALHSALEDIEDTFVFIMAVFQDGEDEGNVIFEIGFNTGLFQRDFSISDSGVISIGEAKQAVRPVTQFVPVEVSASHPDDDDDDDDDEDDEDKRTNTSESNSNSNESRKAMTKDQLIKALVASEATAFVEGDAAWLKNLTEEQLKRCFTSGEGDDKDKDEAQKAEAEAEAEQRQQQAREQADKDKGKSETPPTTEEYISNAPEEVRAVLGEGLRMHRMRKEELVKGVLANSRNTFTEKQLQSKPLDELESLALLANVVTFEGAGGGVPTSEEDENIAPAPDVFKALNEKAA